MTLHPLTSKRGCICIKIRVSLQKRKHHRKVVLSFLRSEGFEPFGRLLLLGNRADFKPTHTDIPLDFLGIFYEFSIKKATFIAKVLTNYK